MGFSPAAIYAYTVILKPEFTSRKIICLIYEFKRKEGDRRIGGKREREKQQAWRKETWKGGWAKVKGIDVTEGNHSHYHYITGITDEIMFLTLIIFLSLSPHTPADLSHPPTFPLIHGIPIPLSLPFVVHRGLPYMQAYMLRNHPHPHLPLTALGFVTCISVKPQKMVTWGFVTGASDTKTSLYVGLTSPSLQLAITSSVCSLRDSEEV